MATPTVKRRRYPAGDSTAESEDENTEISNITSQSISQRRNSSTNEFSSRRLIVSERRQLAVLKQLTASDEPGRREREMELCFRRIDSFLQGVSPSTSTSIILQQRPAKFFRRNEHGETIAHVAARKGDLKRLKKALEEGANVNEEDNAGETIIDINRSFDKLFLSLGWTPLHEGKSFFELIQVH